MAKPKVRYEQMNGIVYRVVQPTCEGESPLAMVSKDLDGVRFRQDVARAIAKELTDAYQRGWDDAIGEMEEKLELMNRR